MALFLQQTDDDGPCARGSYYVGESGSSAGFDRVAEEGGAAGSGLYAVTCVRDGLPGSTAWGCVFACTIPTGWQWLGGDWTVRVKTAPFFGGVLSWTGIRIVRMNSSCVVQDILGELFGFAITCTNAVHTKTITGVDATTPEAGDHIGVLLQFRNGHPTLSQTINVTPDQVIDSPFEEITEVVITPAAAVLRLRPATPIMVRARLAPPPAIVRLEPVITAVRAVVMPDAAQIPLAPQPPRVSATVRPPAAVVRLRPVAARLAAVVRPLAAALRLEPVAASISAVVRRAAARLGIRPRTPRVTAETKPQPRDLNEDQCLASAAVSDCNAWQFGDPSAPACISCVPGPGGTIFGQERDCTLEPTSGSPAQTPLCVAIDPFPSARTVMDCPRGILLRPLPPAEPGDDVNWDVDLDVSPFYAGPGPFGTFCPPAQRPAREVNYKYYLQTRIALLVEPCHPFPCRNLRGGTWLCRAFLNHINGTGWQMWCNPLVHGAQGAGTPPDDVLLEERLLLLDPDAQTRQQMLVHFTTDGLTRCFQYEDQFCFTDKCRLESNTWMCIGANNPNGSPAYRQLSTLDRLFVSWSNDFGYSTNDGVYPHANPADVTLKNQALAMLRSYVEQLDAGGPGSSGAPPKAHARDESYESPQLNMWRHFETFAARPPVTLDGTADGAPVPITCTERITGAQFPATLRLSSVEVTLKISVERMPSWPSQPSGYIGARRAIGCIDLVLRCAVALEPEAFSVIWPFKLRGRPVAQGGTGDPFDLFAEDPQHPGQIHPQLRLLAPAGPGGARVPLVIPWRGLRGPAPFAVEPAFGSRGCLPPGGGAFVCCPTLYSINRAAWFGEFNDFENGGLNPQRYVGSVTTFVADLDHASPHVSGVFGCEC